MNIMYVPLTFTAVHLQLLTTLSSEYSAARCPPTIARSATLYLVQRIFSHVFYLPRTIRLNRTHISISISPTSFIPQSPPRSHRLMGTRRRCAPVPSSRCPLCPNTAGHHVWRAHTKSHKRTPAPHRARVRACTRPAAMPCEGRARAPLSACAIRRALTPTVDFLANILIILMIHFFRAEFFDDELRRRDRISHLIGRDRRMTFWTHTKRYQDHLTLYFWHFRLSPDEPCITIDFPSVLNVSVFSLLS